MKTLIPTMFVLTFLAALTSSLNLPSAGQEACLDIPIPRQAEDAVRDCTSDSVSHPFSDSPEALFLGELEARGGLISRSETPFDLRRTSCVDLQG